ncbi:DUF6804 family protein [Bizionia arctica]
MKLLKLTLAIFILLCLLDMPYSYYQLVRFSAFVCFSFLAYQANTKENKTEAFIYLALALLFQPFFKIALGRTIWNVVDVIVGIWLVLSVLFKPKDKSIE